MGHTIRYVRFAYRLYYECNVRCSLENGGPGKDEKQLSIVAVKGDNCGGQQN